MTTDAQVAYASGMGSDTYPGQVSASTFGVLIAYVLPGSVVVATAGLYSSTVQTWLGISASDAPSIGGFLYATLASVAAGMTLSAIRWLVVDTIHHHTGVPRPTWDVSRLSSSVAAFETFVEHHYRHYLYYANMATALAIAGANPRFFAALAPAPSAAVAAAIIGLVVLHLIASRDALKKYHMRTNELLRVGSGKC